MQFLFLYNKTYSKIVKNKKINYLKLTAPIIIYVWIVMTRHHAPNVKIISARKSFIFNMQQKKALDFLHLLLFVILFKITHIKNLTLKLS